MEKLSDRDLFRFFFLGGGGEGDETHGGVEWGVRKKICCGQCISSQVVSYFQKGGPGIFQIIFFFCSEQIRID